jgi:trimethylguanosine synthase
MTPGQHFQAWKEKLHYRKDLLLHYQPSPFGPAYQEAWNHRYELFSKFDSGIQTDAEGLYSVTPEKVAQEIARNIKTEVIADAFCGVGGSAIAFASHCKKVYALDINRPRLEMAKHNASIYGRTNIEFIEGDFLEIAPHLRADTVFLDPPWGGPSFLQKQSFSLNDLAPNGQQLLDIAFQHFAQVILRVPEKFDLREFGSLNYLVQPNILEGRVISKTVYFHA